MNFNIIQEMLDDNKIPTMAGKLLLDKLNTLELEIRRELHNPKTLKELIETIKKDPIQKKEFQKLLETV